MKLIAEQIIQLRLSTERTKETLIYRYLTVAETATERAEDCKANKLLQ